MFILKMLKKKITNFNEKSEGSTFTISDYKELPLFSSDSEFDAKEITKSNCMYAFKKSGIGQKQIVKTNINVTSDPSCQNSGSLQNMYFASIRCGDKAPRSYACPYINSNGQKQMIDPTSCVNANTNSLLKQKYFGDKLNGGTSIGQWSKETPLGEYEIGGGGKFTITADPSIVGIPGISKKLCFNTSPSIREGKTGISYLVGLAESDGTCNVKSLQNDVCYMPKNVSVDNLDVYPKLTEENDAGSSANSVKSSTSNSVK